MACLIVHASRGLKHFHNSDISITRSLWSRSLLSGSSLSSGSPVNHSTLRLIHLQRTSKFCCVFRSLLFDVSPQHSLPTNLFSRKAAYFSSKTIAPKITSKQHQEKPLIFSDSDKCLITVSSDSVIPNLTFSEAKKLAHQKKFRLVYMNKNSEGVMCFTLEALPDNANMGIVDGTSSDSSLPKVDKEKRKKSTKKEFRFQASITDHDLNIKLNQMQSLLLKGKQLVVFINYSASSSKEQRTTDVLLKKITEDLGAICTIKQNFKNNTTASLALIPKENTTPST